MADQDFRKRMHGALDRMLDGKMSKDGGPGSGPQGAGTSLGENRGSTSISSAVRKAEQGRQKMLKKAEAMQKKGFHVGLTPEEVARKEGWL
jgi:hypothetical protein